MTQARPTPAVARALPDPQGRLLDYLRLAVTDRCNLRCVYCMPEEGIGLSASGEVLDFEEYLRLCRVFCGLGVRKIRITGGEPLVRRGLTGFLHDLSQLATLPQILLTTNGVLLGDHLEGLVEAGIGRINLSLDSLDPANWRRITRRDGFAEVMNTLDRILVLGLGLKLNVVLMAGVNDHEFDDFVQLAKDRLLEVRFIEVMSFDGTGSRPRGHVSGAAIRDMLTARFGSNPVPGDPSSVARIYRIPGFVGTVGVIEGHTRSFCGACNRLRLDARGRLRTCLYGTPQAHLGALLRSGASDDELGAAIRGAVSRRAADGHLAALHQAGSSPSSMASIGG